MRKMIVLHCGQILRELVSVFSIESIIENNLHFKVILPDRKLEMWMMEVF